MRRDCWILGLVSCSVVALCPSQAHAETEVARAEPEPTQHLTWHPKPVNESGSATQSAPDADRAEGRAVDDASRAVDNGQLAPFTLGAAVPHGHADVQAVGGYDSAASTGRARTAAEARVFDWLALRLEYEHGPANGNADRVTFGARAAILRQEAHGIVLGAGFFFQPKDFRGEGDFVGGVLASRRFGRLSLNANAFGGIDSEGDDGSAELRLSALYRATGFLHLGLDGRGRYNFSDDEKRFNAQQVLWEMQAGPTAALTFGPVAVLAVVGPSALSMSRPGLDNDRTRFGVAALGGAGAIF